MYKQRFSKPVMVGGTRPPVGLEWKVVALTKHHGNIIRALSHYRRLPTSDVLGAALGFYISHYADEIDKAFDDYSKRFSKSGKVLHPFESRKKGHDEIK